MAACRNPPIRDGQTATKSLSNNELRSPAVPLTILPMPALIVSKECASRQCAVPGRPQHVILSPEIPGRAKRSSLRQLAVSPNSRAEPFFTLPAPLHPDAQPPTGDSSAVTPTTARMPHVVNDSTDSVALDSVEPKRGTYLKTGHPVSFNITVSYNLVSADSAIPSISTAQLRTSPAGCSGRVGGRSDCAWEASGGGAFNMVW